MSSIRYHGRRMAAGALLSVCFLALGAGTGAAGSGRPSKASHSASTTAMVAAPAGWTLLNSNTSPPARNHATMAYDASTRQVVLFGGDLGYGSPVSDTWVWNGTSWSEAHPTASPSARESAVMAYDAAANQVVLFGGASNVSGAGLLSDTWIWNGHNWHQVFPKVSPPPRDNASMAYDAGDREVVLFGGFGASGNADDLNDTWTWNGTTWSPRSPLTSPPVRCCGTMAYDAKTGDVVLFGGISPSITYFSDTWTWNGTNWHSMSPAESPSGRASPAMAFDGSIGKVMLFGGGNVDNLADTWLWDGSDWNQLDTPAGPPGRNVATMAYDSATQQVILFGGEGTATFNDTWAYKTATTPPVAPTGSVNGFATNLPNSPYGSTAKQMLSKLPKTVVVMSSGAPLCLLQANEAVQSGNDKGLIIIWSVEPTSYYLGLASGQREGAAKVVENYLYYLEAHSRALYLGDLRADRIPLQGTADLSSSWGIRIDSRSTLYQTMGFQVAEQSLPQTSVTTTWGNVPGTSRSSSATEALSNLLYYTKKVAVLPRG